MRSRQSDGVDGRAARGSAAPEAESRRSKGVDAVEGVNVVSSLGLR